ncbi:hypothetical protein N7539_008084 [Penicillium diatomitis]|uniref:Uncharacterized protein n=1 Tax=Penicillium diatomitis TaxID=2819901 RepID=A0A9X0BN60_9EURO|nr:uncharacterized protein N7539_008084 [Penicillium diatomitis]KAJ5475018.1 hypothetical protein N7539_008084 [Penicillium diatomitis]
MLAKEKETDILDELSNHAQRVKLFNHPSQHIHVIKYLTAHPPGLESTEEIYVADQEDWVHGSFNVCILIHIGGHNAGGRKERPLK